MLSFLVFPLVDFAVLGEPVSADAASDGDDEVALCEALFRDEPAHREVPTGHPIAVRT